MKSTINFITFIFASMATVMSCTGKSAEASFMDVLNESTVLQATGRSEASPDGVSRPLSMLCMEGNYVIADDNSQQLLHVFSSDGAKVLHALPKGHGENEALGVHQMQQLDEHTFCIYDLWSRKLFKMAIDSACHVSETKAMEDFMSLSMVGDTAFGICMETDCRYKLHDLRNDSVSRFGSYQDYGLSPHAGKILLQGNIITNPRTRRFAFFSFYGIVWQFGNMETHKLETPVMVAMPEYKNESADKLTFDVNTHIGFLSVTGSDDYVFALYSGKRIKDALADKGSVTVANTIIQYDWNGNIIQAYSISDNTTQIAYDDDNDRLILLSEDIDGYYIWYAEV